MPGLSRRLRPLLRLALLASVTLPALAGCDAGDKTAGGGGKDVKIAFLVKQPEEPWFQTEWKFADKAAADKGFTLVKLGVPDGEQTLTAIDNIAAQGVGGFVICTPDVKLGPAIKARADAHGLKLMTVDDRLVGGDGKPLEDVPHLGISARNIGKLVGQALYDQMQDRGWKPEETGLALMTFDELATAKERTDGAVESLAAAGFPQDRIYRAPQRKSDQESAYNAANVLLSQESGVKHWLIAGMNDNAVIGAVRAMEGRGVAASDTIGVGINGTDALNEFRKAEPTGFYGSILLTAKKHGYDTAEMMYEWVADGKAPPMLTYTNGLLITRDTFERVMAEQESTDAPTTKPAPR